MKAYILSFYNRLDDYPTKYSLSAMRVAAYSVGTQDVELKILPFKLDEPSEIIAQKLIDRRADVVGFPAYMWTSPKGREIAHVLNKTSPLTLNVVGGPETATFNPNSWPDSTLFILGEGEEAFKWILEKKQTNYNFKSSDKQNFHPAIYGGVKSRDDAVKQISDQLPSGVPIYSDKFMEVIENFRDFDNKFTWHDTMVGCQYNCGYCGHRTRQGMVSRANELVELEIKKIGELGFKESFIIDPILGGIRGRDKEILRMYKKHAPETAIRAYYRPEFLDYETIDLLADSNIKEILIGLQSTNPNVPNWLRSNNLEIVKKYLPELSKKNIFSRIELISGLPGDNFQGQRESLRFVVEEIMPGSIWSYGLTVIPGTKLYDILDADKLNKNFWVHIDENHRAIESNSYTKDELDKILIYSGAITSLYNTIKDTDKFNLNNKNLTLDKLEKIVEPYLRTNDEEIIQMFKTSNMKKAADFWRGKI